MREPSVLTVVVRINLLRGVRSRRVKQIKLSFTRDQGGLGRSLTQDGSYRVKHMSTSSEDTYSIEEVSSTIDAFEINATRGRTLAKQTSHTSRVPDRPASISTECSI